MRSAEQAGRANPEQTAKPKRGRDGWRRLRPFRSPELTGRFNLDTEPLTIRGSNQADLAALRRIAELDSQHLPAPPFLVAQVGGEVVAALATETGIVVANPFRHTAQVVHLLRVRADQLAVAANPARTDLGGVRIGRAVTDQQ